MVADAAGSNIADERVFRNISPAADGFLHLSFNSMRSTAMLSGIEVLPVERREGKTGPNSSGLDLVVAGFRRAGVAGRLLFPGRKRAGPHYESRPGEQLNRTGYGALRERALGTFFLRCARGGGPVSSHVEILRRALRKAQHGQGRAGSRIFDVYCNGVALLRGFDILRRLAEKAGR